MTVTVIFMTEFEQLTNEVLHELKETRLRYQCYAAGPVREGVIYIVIAYSDSEQDGKAAVGVPVKWGDDLPEEIKNKIRARILDWQQSSR